MMDHIFSHLCGQSNVPTCDGLALPVCYRCLGLYAGGLIAAAWTVATGLWRRGLPPWSVFLVQAAMLLAAGAGGLGLWGGAPAAKLLCGLWTGAVIVGWLIGGTRRLWSIRSESRPFGWLSGDRWSAWLLLLTVTATAPLMAESVHRQRWLWISVATAGAAAIGLSVIFAAVSVARWSPRKARTDVAKPQADSRATPDI